MLKPWKILRTKTLLEREPWLRVLADDVQLPGGQIIRDYLRVETPDFVVIVPVSDSGEIVMIRSYKHGVGAIDVQLPAGYLEPGEDPLQAAKRELLEETGCQAQAWQALGAYVMSGNRGHDKAHIFLATGCRQIAAPDSGDLEDQEVLWAPLDEVRHRLEAGDYRQIITIASLGLALRRLGEG
jgi:ADP-ribose pyrophosphatase